MNIFEDTAPKSSRKRPIRVVVLGASGSIGMQTLDVCRQHTDKVEVVGLAVRSSTEFVARAAERHGVRVVAVTDERHAKDPALESLPAGCDLLVGDDALEEICLRDDVDCVVSAVVGFAGINAGYAALKAGMTLLYANKESLVVGGDLLKAVDFFDVYRGLPIAPGKKSVAFSLSFRGEDRSLKDGDIEPHMNAILEALEAQLGAKLR